MATTATRRRRKRKRSNPALQRALATYKRAKRTSRFGEGKRFPALVAVLRAKGARNPEALASWIGRNKYGKKRFQAAAAAGRRRKSRRRKRR